MVCQIPDARICGACIEFFLKGQSHPHKALEACCHQTEY